MLTAYSAGTGSCSYLCSPSYDYNHERLGTNGNIIFNDKNAVSDAAPAQFYDIVCARTSPSLRDGISIIIFVHRYKSSRAMSENKRPDRERLGPAITSALLQLCIAAVFNLFNSSSNVFLEYTLDFVSSIVVYLPPSFDRVYFRFLVQFSLPSKSWLSN